MHFDAVLRRAPALFALFALVAATAPIAVPLPSELRPAAASAASAFRGYWLVGSDGGIFAFGDAGFFGSTGALRLNRPIVGTAATPTGRGYWLVASDGGVFTFGDAGFFGSTGAIRLNSPVVGMAPTPSGQGYWLVASDGGIFTFGDAEFFGSTGAIRLNSPVVGMAPTPSGQGYWLVAADGGIFAFGDAEFFGSTGGLRLNRPVVGMAQVPNGQGYWLVASDGGIFAFGAAAFRGSTGALRLEQPIVAMTATPSGLGYWLVGSDGAVFAFGDAPFLGSTAGLPLAAPVVGAAGPPVRLAPEVAAFFYPWYANLEKDGFWRHWEGNGRVPPDDVDANFYPVRGPYSSNDPAVLDAQMAEMAAAGIDTVVSSWWGRGSFEDKVLPAVARAAANRGVRLAIHVEPYAGRTPASVADDIAYLHGFGVTDFYVWEAHRSPAAEWATFVSPIPGTRLLSSIASLRVSAVDFVAAGGFDGLYTYDPVHLGPAQFASVCAAARQRGLLCSPSVAPQYLATRSKPAETKIVSPEGGARYDSLWAGAIDAGADVVSITSYNEWHEGTQIEPARPYCFPDGYCSPGYEAIYGRTGKLAESAFLDRTKEWVARYKGQ